MLTQEYPTTKEEWIRLRMEAHYHKAMHTRALERVRESTAKARDLERVIDSRDIRIKELTASFERTISGQNSQIAGLTQRVEELAAQNTWLKQRVFGQHGEQSAHPTEDHDAAATDASITGAQHTAHSRGQKRGTAGHGRKRRKDLPTVEIVHDLKESDKTCRICGLRYKPFPKSSDSEDIHYEVRITRRIHKRKCYRPACRCGAVPGIVAARPVPKLISKGMFSVELWAHILSEKFLFQRSLSSVLETLALRGLRIPQGTVTGGMRKIKDIVYPLYTRILERNRAANHWHMDETRWLVFEETEGKTGCRWWLWVSVSCDAVAYLLDPSRSSSVPKEHLGEDPNGILCVDRYSAYKTLGGRKLKLSFCWAHVRRDYVRIHDAHLRLRAWAQEWIDRVNLLFHLNNNRLDVLHDKTKFQAADGILRKEIDCFKAAWTLELESQDLRLVCRKALESLQRHWEGLIVFVDHPEIPMDNNLSERKLRPAALGRKNYYGSGAVWSGDLTAALFTVFQTARHNGLDPLKYLTAYLHAAANNGGKPPVNLDDFLPWNLSDDKKVSMTLPP